MHERFKEVSSIKRQEKKVFKKVIMIAKLNLSIDRAKTKKQFQKIARKIYKMYAKLRKQQKSCNNLIERIEEADSKLRLVAQKHRLHITWKGEVMPIIKNERTDANVGEESPRTDESI